MDNKPIKWADIMDEEDTKPVTTTTKHGIKVAVKKKAASTNNDKGVVRNVL